MIITGSVLDIAPAVEGSVTITAPFKRSIKRHILFKVMRMMRISYHLIIVMMMIIILIVRGRM